MKNDWSETGRDISMRKEKHHGISVNCHGGLGCFLWLLCCENDLSEKERNTNRPDWKRKGCLSTGQPFV